MVSIIIKSAILQFNEMTSNFKKHNNNLVSISFEGNDYHIRSFIRNVFEKLLDTSNYSIIETRRPYHGVEKTISKMDIVLDYLKDISCDKYFNEMSFLYDRNKLMDFDFIELCVEVWFEYEQPCFVFSNLENDKSGNNINPMMKNLKWDKKINYYKGYILFRGVEENVIWIGKSLDIEFSNWLS